MGSRAENSLSKFAPFSLNVSVARPLTGRLHASVVFLLNEMIAYRMNHNFLWFILFCLAMTNALRWEYRLGLR